MKWQLVIRLQINVIEVFWKLFAYYLLVETLNTKVDYGNLDYVLIVGRHN
jgi:hypothetical protein